MNIYRLHSVLNPTLYNMFNPILQDYTYEEANSKTSFETNGDILDILQLVEDTAAFHQSNSIHDDPSKTMVQIYEYMKASCDLFGWETVNKHLMQSNYKEYLNKYPNLYRTMEVWVWG